MGKRFDDPTTPLGLLSALEKRLQRDLVGLVATYGDEAPAIKDCAKTLAWLTEKRQALEARQ